MYYIIIINIIIIIKYAGPFTDGDNLYDRLSFTPFSIYIFLL